MRIVNTISTAFERVIGAILPALFLAGCIDDSASFLVDGSKEQTIMLHRVQDWFWQDTVALDIAVTRMPDCQGGIDIEGVPRRAEMALYRAPDEYAEPIYILEIGERLFAISTQSCRVQEFEAPPSDLGTRLGHFQEVGARFAFVAEGASS